MSEGRFVVDTNVLVSAALSREGAARRAVASMLQRGNLLVSTATFAELVAVLHRPKFERYLRAVDRDEYLSLIQAASHFVESRERIAACRDPDDDKFLELAVSGAATFLVTGDADLLVLNPFRGIPIITPATYLDEIGLPDEGT